VLVLGLLVGRLVLTIIAPGPVIEAAAVAAPRVGARVFAGDPFRLVNAAPIASDGETPPEAVDTSLDLTLHGAWFDAEGGSAIIKTPDGIQKRFAVGDEICCGAILERVYADQVTILRGGVREALRLPNKLLATGMPAATVPAETAPPSSPTITSLTDAVRIEAEGGASGGIRLRLFAGSDQALFESLGLRGGDVLVSVNGAAAPTDLNSFAEMMSSLQGVMSASVVIEREGVRMPLDISLAGDQAADG
jgi:type II secretion system protein C